VGVSKGSFLEIFIFANYNIEIYFLKIMLLLYIMEETETTKYYELPPRDYSIDKFKYSLPDIQMENISEGIHDDDLRMAILNPTELKSKMDEERSALLVDLACLENSIIETRADINAQFEDMDKSLKDMDRRLKSQ